MRPGAAVQGARAGLAAASLAAAAQAAPAGFPSGWPTVAPACLGSRQPLTVAGQMPYALASVAGRQGHFVLDFGASLSSIQPAGFDGPPPQPVAGSSDRFDDFVFFGSWGTVRLLPQASSLAALRTRDGVAGFAQAGVIGTDFLARHIYTLDYRGGHLWRADAGRFCDDATLRGAGFKPLSTQGYFGPSPAALSCPHAGAAPGGCANIPALPLRIGPVQAVAQLDTGYDDSRRPLSININGALFDALRAAGVLLRPLPAADLQLSTCVAGLSEAVQAYSLPARLAFGLVDAQGGLLGPPARAVTLYLKRTPAAAWGCGGIGTWPQPAAQLGGSFVSGGALVVDPFSARVWLR